MSRRKRSRTAATVAAKSSPETVPHPDGADRRSCEGAEASDGEILTIEHLTDEEALGQIGALVDEGLDSQDLTLVDRAFAMGELLQARGLAPVDLAALDYIRANGWENRWHARVGEKESTWDWEQPEVRQQIFLLRRALNSDGFDQLDQLQRCQILTNLANQLDKVGRGTEANALWGRALAIHPHFWMARANRGNGLIYYARALYDGGHQGVFALHAHQDLTAAVADLKAHPQLGDWRLAPRFEASAAWIAGRVDLDFVARTHRADGWPMGETSEERSYRQWCLGNRLFLNPLNDVEPCSVAAADVLGLPSFRTGLDEPPIVVGMANELKQNFVSARWLLWEGTHETEPHFSDRDVLLYNTLDYPCHGLAVEKVKMAFRMAYSTFDKIAWFLNFYLSLGIPEKHVSFRSVWREADKGPVRTSFASVKNWPWRGLFWLSADLFDKDMMASTEPDARALAELRNHLEHKYVKVVEMAMSPAPSFDPFRDTLAYTISRSDLERRTLRLLQLARAALIYLFLGMHREEARRAEAQPKPEGLAGFVAPMHLDPLRDDWKR
ncbi:MAG: hypothetical protein JWR80_8910 [Bradyrhizobium sp.]|nr:hypothetical protein [Bradyrhizobium sp.]